MQERFRTSSTPCYMVALTVVTYCDFVDTYFSCRSVLIEDKVGFLLIYDFITIILLSGKLTLIVLVILNGDLVVYML